MRKSSRCTTSWLSSQPPRPRIFGSVTTTGIWFRRRSAHLRQVSCPATTRWSSALLLLRTQSTWQGRVGTRRRNSLLGQLALAQFQNCRRNSRGWLCSFRQSVCSRPTTRLKTDVKLQDTERAAMNLQFLGDALDHWKGSVFETLQQESELR